MVLERWGIPIEHGKYFSFPDPEDREKMLRALRGEINFEV